MTISTKAHALIPGYDDRTEAEKRLNEEIAKSRATKFDSPISSDDFVEAAMSGAEFPAEPHFHNEEIRSERQNAAVRAEMFKAAAKTVQREKQDLIRDHAEAGLDYLRGELSALVEDVLQIHSALGNIRSAEQVLAAKDHDATKTWESTTELISRYNEIRGVQHVLTSPSLGDGQSFKIAAVGHICNSLELLDYWLSKRERSTSQRAANDHLEGVGNFDKWLGSGGTAPFKHSTSAIPQEDNNGANANAWDYLVWLATEADPWVPTTAQLVKAWDAASKAVAVTTYATYRAQEDGRDAYFKAIGREPLVPYTNGSTNEKPEVRKVHQPSWGESAAQLMGL